MWKAAILAMAATCAIAATAPEQRGRGGPPTAEPPPLVLRNVTLIDGVSSARRGVDIVIDGGRITTVRPTSDAAPPGAQVLDVKGTFVIPGLIESHLHLVPLDRQSPARVHRELARMLQGGITVAREMAGDARLTAGLQRDIVVGTVTGPDLYFAAVMAGPNFFLDDPRPRGASLGLVPGSTPWGQAIAPHTDIRLAIARAAGTLATGIKLYMQLAPSQLRDLSAEAHRQGLRVWSHATVYPSRPRDAVAAGVDTITHACGLSWESAALDPSQFARPSLNNRPRFDPALVRPDAPEYTALFRQMVERGVLFEPTLTVHERATDDVFGCTQELVTGLSRAAKRAGVAFLAGTDYAAPEEDPYPSLHLEIERLVATGILTPMEAIAAATINGARALGLEKTHGSVEPGKIANLVVLAEDPTEKIGAIRTVLMTIKNGRVYQRASSPR